MFGDSETLFCSYYKKFISCVQINSQQSLSAEEALRTGFCYLHRARIGDRDPSEQRTPIGFHVPDSLAIEGWQDVCGGHQEDLIVHRCSGQWFEGLPPLTVRSTFLMLFISWQAEPPDSFETGGSAKIMPQIRFAGRTQKNCSDQPATSTGLIGVGTFLRSDG